MELYRFYYRQEPWSIVSVVNPRFPGEIDVSGTTVVTNPCFTESYKNSFITTTILKDHGSDSLNYFTAFLNVCKHL